VEAGYPVNVLDDLLPDIVRTFSSPNEPSLPGALKRYHPADMPLRGGFTMPAESFLALGMGIRAAVRITRASRGFARAAGHGQSLQASLAPCESQWFEP